MKAILVAGGLGTRLGRLTRDGRMNKHALPVYDRPMIELVVQTLVAGGCDDILVMLNGRNPHLIPEILEYGEGFGCDISFKHTNDVRQGPVRHFLAAERWVDGQPFVLMLGDSIFTCRLDFTTKPAPHIWVMPLNQADDHRKYGQVEVDGDRVVRLVEKPQEQFSNLISTGAWLFPPDVFDAARSIDVGGGEFQFGDLSQYYVTRGMTTCTHLTPGSYIDAGTHEALFRAAAMRRDSVRAARTAAE